MALAEVSLVGPVEGPVGASADPFASVEAAISDGGFDEVIISTLSKETSKWLRRDQRSTHAHDGRDDGRAGVRLRDRHPEAADAAAVDPQSDAGVQAGRERELA